MSNDNNPAKIFPDTYQPLRMSSEPRKIKCEIDASIFTVYIPIPEENELNRLDKCIWFLQAVEDECTKEVEDVLGEDEETAGKLLHRVWRRCLPALERVTWNAIPNNDSMEPLSLANWHDKAHNWILSKCGRDNAVSVLQQLRTWRKPRHVTVPDNYHYMTKVNNAVEFMSSTEKKLDANELKRVFFNSHPYAWKRAFEEIHGFPEDKNNTTSKIL